jgi:hypothetical protein
VIGVALGACLRGLLPLADPEPPALARSYSGVSPFARPWMKSIASRVAW